MRRALVLSLCCLVLVAGCSGPSEPVTPGGTSPAETTHATTPTDGPGDGPSSDGDAGTARPTDTLTAGGGTPTATPGPFAGVEFPPGTAESGITNATALVAAHRGTLSDTDFAVRLSSRSRFGENTSRATQVVRSSLDSRRAYTRFATDNFTVATYRNATRFYRNQTFRGESQYEAREAGTGFESYHEGQTKTLETTRDLFRLGNYSAAGTVERDGRTLVRFTLDSVNRSAVNASSTVLSASGELLVDERGVVHEGNVSVETRRDGIRRAVEIRFTLTEEGDVSVEPPGWLDDAEAAPS